MSNTQNFIQIRPQLFELGLSCVQNKQEAQLTLTNPRDAVSQSRYHSIC